MTNNSVTTNTMEEQHAPRNPEIEGAAIQALFLNTTLKDQQRYSCAKIFDLQNILANLVMYLELKALASDNTPSTLQQAIDKARHVLRKTGHHLRYQYYNLSALHLDRASFAACEINHLIEGVLSDKPSLKILCYEWINTHDFCFYGPRSEAEAMIANLFDVAYQAAYQTGEGVIKLWTITQSDFNQLHIQVDLDVHTPRWDDKRWPTLAPQASFRLTLALCHKVMTAVGGNIYFVAQRQGSHFILSFPKMVDKR